MAGLKLQAVSKSWDGKTQVIQPLTLDVVDGEFIVMVGPSGCGKSTLLRMVAGLERVTSGDIWIDRKRVTEMEPKDRGIAMVFQNYALYPHMSVEENMAWGLKIRGMGKGLIAERVQEAARILELDGLLKRRPRELSGGQRQRVLIAMALTRDPKLIIADEPTTALDVTVQKQVIDLLNKLQKELGFAMVFVSHDLALVAEVANSITVMYAGQVVEQGPVSDILCHPVHEYTRGLLGSVLSIEAGGTRLHQVPGSVPSPKDFPEGDRFTPRSSHPDKVSQLRPVLKRVSDSDHYYAELPDSELKRLGIKPYVPGGAII